MQAASAGSGGRTIGEIVGAGGGLKRMCRTDGMRSVAPYPAPLSSHGYVKLALVATLDNRVAVR